MFKILSENSVCTIGKFPPRLKCITTLPCEIWMFEIATKLAQVIQSKVKRTG